MTPDKAVAAFAACVDKYCKNDTARALLVRQISALLSAAAQNGNGALAKVTRKRVVPLAFRLLGASSATLRSDLELLVQVLFQVNKSACDDQVRVCVLHTDIATDGIVHF